MIEIDGVKYKTQFEMIYEARGKQIEELKIENFELRNTIKHLLDYIKQEIK